MKISDVTLKTFLIFLEYLYTDHAPLEKENALEVLALANQYAVLRLMAMCELFISEEAEQLMADKIDQEDLDVIGMFIFVFGWVCMCVCVFVRVGVCMLKVTTQHLSGCFFMLHYCGSSY